jgi:hypothetical protein
MPGIIIPAVVVAAVAVVALVSSSSKEGASGGEIVPGTIGQAWSKWRVLSMQIKMDPDHFGGGRIALTTGKLSSAPKSIELLVQVVLYTKPQLYRCVGFRGTVADGKATWSTFEHPDCHPNGVKADEHGIVIEPTTSQNATSVVTWIRTPTGTPKGYVVQRVRWMPA